MRVDISSNISRVRLEVKAIADDVQSKATVRALNRAGRAVITEAPREVAKAYNVKIGTIKRQMKLQPAQRGRLTAVVRIYGKRIPLSEFSARQTPRGVTVSIRRNRKLIRGAFLRTMRSGHRGVFVRAQNSRGIAGGDIPFRRGKGSRIAPKGQNDLPIAQLFTLSVPTMVLDKQILAATKKVAVAVFEKNFRQQVDYLTRPR
jgi:hypothetical protein